MNKEVTTKKKILYMVAIVIGVITLIFLSCIVSSMKEKTKEMQTETEILTAWEHREKKESRRPLLRKFLRESGVDEVSTIFEKSGCHVTDIEEDRTDDDKRIMIYHVKGTGNFSQMLSAFDIIGEKDTWMVVELRKIKAEKGMLSFETDIRTYRD